MRTDQQQAYAKALRDAVGTRALAEAATPLTEDEAARMLSGVHGEAGLRKVQEMQERRRDAAQMAEAEAHRCAALCEVQLGRPLTRHERESGFDALEHEWWLSNPRDPCPECVSPEVAAVLRRDPRTAYKALLGRTAPRLPRRGHSEACDCRECVPCAPEPEPLTPAEEARRAEQKARLSEEPA